MKAVVVSLPGGPEVLEFKEVPTPRIKPGWSLVKVHGVGVNHSEIFTRQGHSPSVQFPRILGIEAVGEIAETTDVARLPVGQKVFSIMGEMGRDYDGGYAEYVLLPNEQIFPTDTKLNWEDFAVVPETYYVAFGSVEALQLKSSDRFLVRAATSDVGVAALKLARAIAPGITVVGSTRSASKVDLLREAGSDDVLIEQDGELPADAGEFDKILDLVGPDVLPDSFKHLAEFGILCITGLLGGQWTYDIDAITDIPNNRYLTGFYSGDVTQKRIDALFTLIEEKNIDIQPAKTFPLAQAADAHRYLESHQSFGKVVLIP